MNEQLIVKNFGPIKDATVDFKRVTVFIGPTGGGKSTLAKLAAVFRDESSYPSFYDRNKLIDDERKHNAFSTYNVKSYFSDKSSLLWRIEGSEIDYNVKKGAFNLDSIDWNQLGQHDKRQVSDVIKQFPKIDTKKLQEVIQAQRASKLIESNTTGDNPLSMEEALKVAKSLDESINQVLGMKSILPHEQVHYLPSERSYVSSIDYAWPGMLRDDIGLPKSIVSFANAFSISRKGIKQLSIPFVGAKYFHQNGQDFIETIGSSIVLRLYETASGIQSVTPMLVLLEHLSRNAEQAQSFIIEEPELNLYPTAQQGLLNWLVEKCTKGENDLTITTHSPYLLAHFNTLLFAHQVAHNHPERVDEVAKVVPRESWIDPKEFAAYHVDGQKENGVRSIVNPETGLISYNGLDAIASAEAAEFEKLLDLNAGLEVA